MKKIAIFIVFVFFFACGIFSINAQDLVILKDGNIIEVKVIEITPTEIRYRRLNHLDGPIIVIPKDSVLSIRYENGMTEIINNSTVTGIYDNTHGQQPNSPSLIQNVLNAMPAIPIAGNTLKFEFAGDTWTAKINGENFSAGNIGFEVTADGFILILKQTHIWPGAVGKTAGRVASRIPGGSAVGGALDTAGRVAGAVGAIEASGPEIVLEYKAGPPATLLLVSVGNTTTDDIVEHEEIRTDHNPRLNTIGASVGSSFGVPWFVGSVHTTYSFFPYAFFELGLDLGGQKELSFGNYKNMGYFFLYPYIDFNGFVPLKKGGWYAGIGFGVMFSRFSFSDVPQSEVLQSDEIQWLATPALNINTGFVLFNFLSISYTQRIRLGDIGTNGKFSIGFLWRY
jgi:hypothetical protein